jgi:hypothetical protein
MKTYYASRMNSATAEFKASLASAVKAEQTGNESRYQKKPSEYPLSLETINGNIKLSGKGLFQS